MWAERTCGQIEDMWADRGHVGRLEDIWADRGHVGGRRMTRGQIRKIGWLTQAKVGM
jgi:hypothetical protein